MKKINTAPLSGMQELLPTDQATFNRLKHTIAKTYHAHGFLPIETPVIDRTDILLAKAGGETEKQIYKVVKTAETADDSDQALRFDHTVPLARYIVEHESDLTFPFKVSQIGRNFRGERAQKGRFREFYQCDVDIVGRGQLALAYDAETILTSLSALNAFHLNTPVLARVSNRKLLSGLIEALDLTAHSADIFSIIDHSEKVTPEKTHSDLSEIGLSSENVVKITTFMDIHGDRATVIRDLENLAIDHPTFQQGTTELGQVLGLLPADQIIADMKIVRGLDYYTGTVFEFYLPEYKEVGSIGGGGRYDNLTSHFTDQAFPSVGSSIGLSRLYYILKTHNLLEDSTQPMIDICLIPISSAEFTTALSLADQLRRQQKTVDVVLFDKKLGDKLSYAAKIAAQGIVIGANETSTGSYKIKNFATGEEQPLEI